MSSYYVKYFVGVCDTFLKQKGGILDDKLDQFSKKEDGGLDRHYTIKKAGEILCLAPSTIRKKISQGIIKKAQICPNGRVLIPESEIKRLLKGNTSPRPEAPSAPEAIPDPLPAEKVDKPADDPAPKQEPEKEEYKSRWFD